MEKEEVATNNEKEDVASETQDVYVKDENGLDEEEKKVVDKAKELATNTLDNYTSDELNFYDFSYFLKWEGEDTDKVITGNKHHSLDSITWINS